MKKIAAIALLLLIPMMASAQGFSFNEGKFKWKFVYEESISCNDLFRRMLLSNEFSNIMKLDDSTIYAEILPKKIDVEQYGFKRMKSPTFFMHYKFGGSVLIELKPTKYRVTVSNMKMTNVSSNFAPIGEIEGIEYFILTDDAPNETLNGFVAPILGERYYYMFLFKPMEEEEW